MPVRINSRWRFDSFPTSSVSNSLSRVMICEALKWRDPGTCLPPRRLDSSLRSRLQDRDARCIRSRPPCKPGFATFSSDGTDARPQRKSYQELRSQFSYPKNKQRHDRVQTCKPTGNVAFTINLYVVRQPGVTIPQNVLTRADKAIR